MNSLCEIVSTDPVLLATTRELRVAQDLQEFATR